MTGELLPFRFDANEEVLRGLNVFPSNKNNIPTLTITHYNVSYYSEATMSIRVNYRKRWCPISLSAEYCLLRQSGWPFGNIKSDLPTAPLFCGVMFIDRQDVSMESMKKSVDDTDEYISQRRRIGSSRFGSGLTMIKMDSLVAFLGKHGKGPYIVLWDGRQTFSVYSLEGEHLYSLSNDDDDFD